MLVAGPSGSPRAVKREEVALVSPHLPATSQPFHDVMDLPWPRAVEEARKTESVIEGVAEAVLRNLLHNARFAGLDVRGVGVVGSPDRDLATIGNPHIRAHAAEGILFRRVLETSAVRMGLPMLSYAERGLETRAAAATALSPATVRSRLAGFGASLGRPWRADEKAAAMAAWLALAASET